jgi:hypothetical protein
MKVLKMMEDQMVMMGFKIQVFGYEFQQFGHLHSIGFVDFYWAKAWVIAKGLLLDMLVSHLYKRHKWTSA